MKKIYIGIVLMSSFLISVAQPTVLYSSINTTPRVAMTDLGSFRQGRMMANQSGYQRWAFHIGTTGSPDYSNCWRIGGTPNSLSYGNFIPAGFANGANFFNNSGTDGELNSVVSGSYYTFNILENGAANSNMQLLETNFNPTIINNVTQSPLSGSVSPTNTVAISVTTATPPSAGENVFVRYSSNSFATSTLIQATFIGNNGIAYIPCQSTGTVIQYYIFSSNETLLGVNSDVTTFGQSSYDMATLNLNNNGGFNYSYTVGAPTTSVFWVGSTNSDWFNIANWPCGVIPTTTTNVVVPAGLANYPIITAGAPTANNIDIAIGATVTVTSPANFNLFGNVTGNNNFDLTNGFLTLRSSAVALSGAGLKDRLVKDLIISASCALSSTVDDILKVTNTITFGTSGNTFNTNGNLTLVSTASNTASVPDMTNAGMALGNSITGDVSVERYIPSGRKWRYLATNTIGTQTIQNSYMEGQAAGANLGQANRGVWITNATSAGAPAGFDATSPFASMKYWNGTDYTNITNPTSFDIKTEPAYMTFVRGDRGSEGTNSINSATTLRTKGTLYQNAVPLPQVATAGATFTGISNRYPSAIDLTKLIYTPSLPVNANFRIWDPNLGGGYTLGAFQPISFDGANFILTIGGGSYGAAGAVMNTIESGQAFFIEGGATPISIQFQEIAKNLSVNNVFFTIGKQQKINALLSVKDATFKTLVDGVMVDFKSNYSSDVNYDDAKKLPNTSENISIKNNNTLLAIERRGLVQDKDTLQLNLTGLRIKDYQWNIDVSNLDEPGREAFLWDRHLGTKKALLLNAANLVDFAVTSTATSYAANRFYITFKQNAIPLLGISLTATKNQNGIINTQWVASNEAYVGAYILEKSADGTIFNTIANKSATNNNGATVNYAQTDSANTKLAQYYRIKASLANGTSVISNIAKIDAEIVGTFINVYPNPIQNSVLNVTFANKKAGNYNVQLIDKAGKVIFNKVINIVNTNENKILNLNKAILAGSYSLIIKSITNDTLYTTEVIIK